MRVIIFALLTATFCTTRIVAQTSKSEQQRLRIQVAVDSVFNSPLRGNLLKGGLAVYVMNFKLEIVKNKNGAITVSQPTANDSLRTGCFRLTGRLPR